LASSTGAGLAQIDIHEGNQAAGQIALFGSGNDLHHRTGAARLVDRQADMGFALGAGAEHGAQTGEGNGIHLLAGAPRATEVGIHHHLRIAVATGHCRIAVDRHRRHAVLARRHLVDRKPLDPVFTLQHVGESLVDLGLGLVFLDRLLELGSLDQGFHQFRGVHQLVATLLDLKVHQFADTVANGADLSLQEFQQAVDVRGNVADLVGAALQYAPAEVAFDRLRGDLLHRLGRFRERGAHHPPQQGERHQRRHQHRQTDQADRNHALMANLGEWDIDLNCAQHRASAHRVTLQAVGHPLIRCDVGNHGMEDKFAVDLDQLEDLAAAGQDLLDVVMHGVLGGETRSELGYHRRTARDPHLIDPGYPRHAGKELLALLDGAVDHALGEANLHRLRHRPGVPFSGIDRELAQAERGKHGQHRHQHRQDDRRDQQDLVQQLHDRPAVPSRSARTASRQAGQKQDAADPGAGTGKAVSGG
jgi:hypothetical protein